MKFWALLRWLVACFIHVWAASRVGVGVDIYRHIIIRYMVYSYSTIHDEDPPETIEVRSVWEGCRRHCGDSLICPVAAMMAYIYHTSAR